MKKVVVITGTSSGVGFTLAEFLIQKNYIVYGLSRSIPKEANFITIPTDITKKQHVTQSIEQIISKEKRIDILVNNAGKGMVGAVEDAKAEEITELFDLNVIACIHTISAVLPTMRQQKSGKILIISSIGSEMGLPFRGFYSASKSAIDRVVEAIRYEVQSFGISVTSLHLGDVQTGIAENRIQSIVSDSYTQNFNTVYEGMNAHVNEGLTALEVAISIEKLLHKKSLKPHYYIGKFGQKMGIYLKKFLPQTWFEALMFRYSGLKKL